MKVHFIAIGGSVMHNLAIALHRMGHEVSGSDDQIYDPASTKLSAIGILPAELGWFPDRIHAGLDAVILGMHAKADNPELMRAQDLGIRVYSFPEFIHAQSLHKQRVVIAGSHGKTTITAMVMHVLKQLGRKFDYLVGAQLEGFDTMVRLSKDAPIIILEGDEYLASALDRRPKFALYKPHVVAISGIAWDHMNVFPTEAIYQATFEGLVRDLPKAGILVYNEEDKAVKQVVRQFARDEEHYLHPYTTPDYRIVDWKYEVKIKGHRATLEVIGKHNMANVAAAAEVCKQFGIETEIFLQHIATFKGAAKRLELIHGDTQNRVYRDFAHAPSKVKATVEAVKELYTKQHVVAVLELHTFSSLNKQFLSQYKRSLRAVKQKVVYVDAQTLAQKGYPAISLKELQDAFDEPQLEYATTPQELQAIVRRLRQPNGNVVLLMSSGNFGGLDPKELALG